jgi:hypothetical protein
LSIRFSECKRHTVKHGPRRQRKGLAHTAQRPFDDSTPPEDRAMHRDGGEGVRWHPTNLNCYSFRFQKKHCPLR